MKRNFIALKTPADNPPCQCEQGCSCIFTDLVTKKTSSMHLSGRMLVKTLLCQVKKPQVNSRTRHFLFTFSC
jgi:hypothetical protein